MDKVNPGTYVLTFDIEDWFHILDNPGTREINQWEEFPERVINNTDRIIDLLLEKNIKASFFCLGWIAKKYPSVIKKIIKNGFEIGTHSYQHQLVYDLDAVTFRNDLVLSLKILEDLTGNKITMFRAPGFSIGAKETWAFEILADCGITIDSSIFPAKRAHGGFETYTSPGPSIININGYKIKEFPINVFPVVNRKFVFSGGGYFRLCPQFLLKYLFGKSRYVMTYFHPRDFDPDQPRLKDLSLTRQFKTYCGLSGSFKKFQALLDKYPFNSLSAAANCTNWEKVPVIKL